ncbi:MAG TPA: LUD domain-containing protein [Pirellulales bacterium]|nr:LUD domain-containing protein [Pirellulales bacterium]
MTSKVAILAAIRKHPLPPRPLPELNQAWIEYHDRPRQFAEMLESVGGHCRFVENRAAIDAALDEAPAYREAKKIVSLAEGIGRGNVDLNEIADPHDLEDLDFAILPGCFAVAENGAVWMTDMGVKHRAVAFIAQHLALVLPANEIVDNMHQAYQRLEFEQSGFGVFISGPSKTADIEQSLVIGAHGPRSLTVFCVQSPH